MHGIGSRWLAVVVLVALTALGAAACSGEAQDDSGAASSELERKPMSSDAEFGSAGAGAEDTEPMSGGAGGAAALPERSRSAARAPSVEPSVIKTAELELRVGRKELNDSIQAATTVASRYGGYVLSSSLEEDDAERTTLVIRVPSPSFEDALANIEDLGTLRRQTVSGKDVGQEFVDLNARLRNWRTQEAVLLELMGRAETIDQTIRVQSELSQVQLQIEQLRGRLRYLQDQTTFGTITAAFVTRVPPAPGGSGTVGKAWSRAVELALAMASFAIMSLGVVVPLALLALIAWFVMRALRPRLSS